jgi:hypothetical protein
MATPTIESVIRALAAVTEPERPRDGDCLRFEPLITRVLVEAGLPARQIEVLGWIADSVVFVHRATVVGTPTGQGIVVDFTVGQYRLFTDLPRRWIAPAPDYCKQLGVATGVLAVMLDSSPGTRGAKQQA